MCDLRTEFRQQRPLGTVRRTTTVPVLVGNKQQDLMDNRHPCYAGHLSVGSLGGVGVRSAVDEPVAAVGRSTAEVAAFDLGLSEHRRPTRILTRVRWPAACILGNGPS